MALILCAVLLVSSLAFIGAEACVVVLFVAQLILLIGEVRKRQVSGVGGFIFMSFLFFGMRPLHLLIESDYHLWTDLFRISVDLQEWSTGMWWGTCGMLFFAIGAEIKARRNLKIKGKPAGEISPARSSQEVRIGGGAATILLIYQLVSLVFMYRLSDGGRSLYGSTLGAYAYDLPMPLQAGHMFAVVVILERYLAERSTRKLLILIFSGFLFLLFSWLMREVSMFRGFYVAGIMIAGIAVLSRLKERVSLYWLILPIVILQPLFRTLGERRFSDNADLKEQAIVAETLAGENILGSYWQFYDSNGDMNIFDTFVAARAANPAYRPYMISWLYVPVHLVPRSVWKTKPELGTTQDIAFLNGAPYAPGIAGFFVLDGGDFWMLGCMMLLGYLVAYADLRVLQMPHGYLRCCLIAILSVNAMFLTRFFLWQYFYQVLYAVVPCIAFAYLFRNARQEFSSGQKLGRENSINQRRG